MLKIIKSFFSPVGGEGGRNVCSSQERRVGYYLVTSTLQRMEVADI